MSQVTDHPVRRLAVVGDSIAEGVGDDVTASEGSWVPLLATELRRGGQVDLLNLGVRGRLAAEVRATQLDVALRFGPDLAVVCAGGNDVLGRSYDAAAVASELDEMVGALARAGALVVTFGLFDLSGTALVPPDRRPALRRRTLALNDAARAAAERHHGVHVDFFADLHEDLSLLSTDLVHPNRRGHAHVAAEVVAALAAERARRPPGQSDPRSRHQWMPAGMTVSSSRPRIR